jgi:hypothetical protein
MLRRIVSALLFVAVCVPVLSVSASTPSQGKAAQAAAGCNDATYLTTVGTDFTGLGTTFKGIDTTAPATTANAILSIGSVRQKYEDTAAPDGCLQVNITVIVTLANAGDLAALVLASQVDTKTDPKVYKDAITAQTKRFQTFSQLLTTAITGVAATPAATTAS